MEFLDGMKISSESFIIDGRVYTVGLSERNYGFLEKFAPFVIENGGNLSPSLTDEQRDKIDEQISRCADVFNVINGIIKGDLVICREGVFVIEVALRLSGGHFSSLEIPLNTGIDFLRYAILMSLGEAIDPEDLKYMVKQYVSLRYIFPNKKGLSFPEWFENNGIIKAYGLYYKPGDRVNYPVRSHPERLGFFLAASRDSSKLRDIVSLVYRDILVDIV